MEKKYLIMKKSMLKKLSILLTVCVLLPLFALPVAGAEIADEDRGLRVYLYDFAVIENDGNIGAMIDAGMDEGRDFFGEGRLIGEVPFTVPTLTMFGDDMEWWTEQMMPEDREHVHHDFFGLRVHGYMTPRQSGTYTLRANVDNGYRLWVNGELWFEQWEGGYWTDQTGEWPESIMPMQFEAGQVYEIYAEFIENWGGQQILLEWSIDGGNYASVPDGIFFRTREAADAGAYLILNPPEPVEEAAAETPAPPAEEAAGEEPGDGNGAEDAAGENGGAAEPAAQAPAAGDDDGMPIGIIIAIIAGVLVVIIIIAVVAKKGKK